ncbi:uncharacterized protein FFE2_16064 [Fusarium fujikuroi]|nr:uncharacterized protein FFE2_16064 [Fusarium fujikuroi]SCV36682.1 uncharacterized protein FFFS_05357 [Fusarium fujikuroi]
MAGYIILIDYNAA